MQQAVSKKKQKEKTEEDEKGSVEEEEEEKFCGQVKVILVKDQLDAQFFFVYIHSKSLHVSSIHALIMRRINCINTTSGICHSK
jgi:hypothetical protein